MSELTFLVLDCSTSTSYVRVVKEGQSWHQQSNEAGAHSESLGALIESCLKKAKIEMADLQGLGLISGPGSFTGLRIAASHLSGIAAAAKKPLVAIPLHLAAVAEFVSTLNSFTPDDNKELVVVSPAGLHSVFCSSSTIGQARSLRDISKTPYEQLLSYHGNPSVVERESLRNQALQGAHILIGFDKAQSDDLQSSIQPLGLEAPQICKVSDPTLGASYLLQKVQWPAYSTLGISNVDLNYIRPVNAKTIAERLAGRSLT
jgi:tRNA threonylcarbamoyl adenosine modification protein YeaZ